MDIVFDCPNCEQELAVDSSGAGSEIRPTGNLPSTRFAAAVNGFMALSLTTDALYVDVLNTEGKTHAHNEQFGVCPVHQEKRSAHNK